MKELEIVHTLLAPEAIGPYSQAIAVGDFVFTSGQIPLTASGELIQGDAATQARQVFDNLNAVLKEAGSTLQKVVKATVFLSDMNDFSLVNSVYEEAFEGHKPARSAVQVARLPRDVKVEIEVVALR